MIDNRGISLITLIITIIIMIILAAIGIRIATDGIDSTAEARIINEKKELETAIIDRFANNAVNEESFPLLGSVLSASELSDISDIKIEDIDYIRKVNKSDIQSLGVKNTTGRSYVVDYLAGAVFGPIE